MRNWMKGTLLTAVAVSVLAIAGIIWAGTISEDWNGSKQITGVTYGDYVSVSPYGPEYRSVVIHLWDAAQPFLTDTSNADSTPTLRIDEWLGDHASLLWTYTSDTTANCGLFDILWQTKNSPGGTWYTAATLTAVDSATEGTYCDTIDFSDPVMRAPYGRIKIDGGATNDPNVIFSAWLRLYRER